jgi:hypothetical protein
MHVADVGNIWVLPYPGAAARDERCVVMHKNLDFLEYAGYTVPVL